jgi:hypothetical protein
MKVLIPIVIGLMIAVIGLSCGGDPAPLSESEIGNKASLFLDSPVVQSGLDLHDDALMLYVHTDDAKWFRKAIHYRSEICSYVESKTSDYSKEDQDKIVSVIFERDEWSRGYFSDKQADKREPEKGSTDDSKPKGFWPW